MKFAFVFLVLSACSCGEKHEAPAAPTLDTPATSPSDTDAKSSDTDAKPSDTDAKPAAAPAATSAATPTPKKDI